MYRLTCLRMAIIEVLQQALACSLQTSNPGIPLIVMTAAGDLAPETLEAVTQFGQLHVAEDFSIQNWNLPRCGLAFLPDLLLNDLRHDRHASLHCRPLMRSELLQCCRFSGNWLKLRGWQMADYDGLLMLDGDMMVVRRPNPNSCWALQCAQSLQHCIDYRRDRFLKC